MAKATHFNGILEDLPKKEDSSAKVATDYVVLLVPKELYSKLTKVALSKNKTTAEGLIEALKEYVTED